ncbi:ABC transporter permease [Deltaproteobacteria bacterium TL4]
MTDNNINYTPNGVSFVNKKTFFKKIRLQIEAQSQYWDLVWSFFVREFSVRYKQSVLGIVWAFLLPLLTIGMFIILNSSGVLNISGVNVPYIVYALIGLMTWNLFSVSFTTATTSLVNAGGMIAKINFPRSSLVLSTSAIGIVEFLIRLPLLIAVLVYYDVTVDFESVFLWFLSLIPVYLFAVGMGFFLSIVAGVVRDVIVILPIFINVLMMLTPIMYPIDEHSLLGLMNYWNPFNYLINTSRNLLLYNQPLSSEYWITAVLIAIIFITSLRFFRITQPKIAERI